MYSMNKTEFYELVLFVTQLCSRPAACEKFNFVCKHEFKTNFLVFCGSIK